MSSTPVLESETKETTLTPLATDQEEPFILIRSAQTK